MLYSTPEDREKRSEMYNNPMTSSGDTIASLAFNDKMSWDKNEDTLNYSDTFTTLGDTVF